MRIAPAPRLAAALITLALWALAAASVLYWVWRVQAPPEVDAPVAGNPGDLEQAADPQAVARALGATGARVAAGTGDGRFVLRGVVTHGPDSGAALIAVDGKPPRPVRVGAPVMDADGWTLRAVTPRGAVLANGVRAVSLDVPKPDARLDTYANQQPQAPYGSRPDVRIPAPAMPSAVQRGPGLMAPRSPQQP
ncbi:MAG: general secretion pathway protein C [Burkholderiaceae bacterium]|jgi:general secretion pathway protein C|nr:general secretion pathway protein C [Burkholderiaceae bacterium]